jgi:hypothetical protein
MLKNIILQVVIKLDQQELKYYSLRSTHSLILFEPGMNCLIREEIMLQYQFTETLIILTADVIMGNARTSCIQNIIQYSSRKVKSM